MSEAQPKLVLQGWFMLDSFIIASEKRAIGMFRRDRDAHCRPPYCIGVFVPRQGLEGFPVVLSTAEYYSRDLLERDFETRRPKMRDADKEDMPMSKGKRLIQEVMQEKLGG